MRSANSAGLGHRTGADRRRAPVGDLPRARVLRTGSDRSGVRPGPAATAARAGRALAHVPEQERLVVLPQIQIARAHWVLGALFLAIILEEYVPLVGRDGRRVRSRSLLVPWALMLGAVGVWATTVFADIVHDMLVHTRSGDILVVAGALELARRRAMDERPWLSWARAVAVLSCGALTLVHAARD